MYTGLLSGASLLCSGLLLASWGWGISNILRKDVKRLYRNASRELFKNQENSYSGTPLLPAASVLRAFACFSLLPPPGK